MMSPSENEEDAKKTGVRPEPLCLFCYPEDVPSVGGQSYVNTLSREPSVQQESVRRLARDARQKEELWLRKRTEARIRRRRMKEPVSNLKSYLLASVKNDKSPLPSLLEVLETVKDAWPSPKPKSRTFFRNENQTPKQPQSKPKMKNEEIIPQLNRRLSVPETLMRKYSVSKEKTSEESETNKTAIDISPSSESTVETARLNNSQQMHSNVAKSTPAPEPPPKKTDAIQQTSDSDEEEPNLPKRVTQTEYYDQGQRIIKMRGPDKVTCTCQSSTTASAKDETDDSATTESILSSSPTQLPKRESSSGNLSSESDNIRCTCAELSSKETSTDLYLSGKSTLSQTVSDKSMSTQDSTVSVNSVSSRGSTVSDNSQSTTPEIERTSAKETTTSPDYSPRTPRNRKNRRRDKHLPCHKTCPKHSRNLTVIRQCPVHSDIPSEGRKTTANVATNTDCQEDSKEATESGQKTALEEPYKWAKLSQEELYMMQQLRHRRFIESQKRIVSTLPDIGSMTGSVHTETERPEQRILIPRYSALPRSLSMLVNTSSPDSSHHSDSDNQSLADSLEDQPVTHVHKLFFDTKKESKPVRGDASLMQDTKQKHRQPRGRAFFVSIKEPYGEDEMLENIEKIPQPPEKIKNQIFKRHLNLCTKHKHRHPPDDQRGKKDNTLKSKKAKVKKDESERSPKARKTREDNKKSERRMAAENSKRKENEKAKPRPTETGTRKKEGRFGSKIPVPVSSRSTSSSPERDPGERPKTRLRREKEVEGAVSPPTEVETTQILEITHAGTELSLQKPQAVIHPSTVPQEKAEPQLVMPPLRIPPFRQTWNKQPLAAVRRSPIGKFRQRFEVIPEEKSSSLSSAEEKNARECLPKFADASTSPLPSEKIQFQSYSMNEVPNLIVAKIASKQLETLPYVNGNDSQKIILFSSKPQNSNSSKGRDALIAMNREDFNRLAKGWMNFYKLNDNIDNSETEGKSKETAENPEPGRQGHPKLTTERTEGSCPQRNQQPLDLGDNIRFDSSNTILRSALPIDSSRSFKKQTSLPELELPGGKSSETRSCSEGALPLLGKGNCVDDDDDDSDSDSTDYMEPPSPRVPPLPMDEIPSDATLSSSDSEIDIPQPQITSQTLKHLKNRSTTNRRLRKDNLSETLRCGKKKNSGWSVTVAGTVELSRSAPDLEMRLSFPATGGPPVVSQSDSGFAEESNYSKLSESLQELDLKTSRKELPHGQKWMVTVKKPKKESGNLEHLTRSSHRLPDLEPPHSRNPNKVLKDVQAKGKMRRLVERKMRAIWPKVQKVIQKEFLTDSGRFITELDESCCLSVRGSAVPLGHKQKPPTMTERDVTRRYTSRGGD